MWLLYFMLAWHFHPIHVSVTEIEFNEKNKALQIVSRIFIDDLELAVRHKTNQESLDILAPKNGATTDQLVASYLQDHIRIRLDDKPVKVKYIAHEEEDLALICYLEIEGVKKFKTIEITNTTIQEIHGDQSNLVHVTYKGPVKSLRLVHDKPTDVLRFEMN